MTREETMKLLAVLRTAYQYFYSKYPDGDINAVVNLWHTMFADDDSRIVTAAVMALIETHTGFPPDIAAVKNKINDLISTVSGEASDEELWHQLKRAISNGLYGSVDEFEKLPPLLKRYVGSPSTLRDLAEVETDTMSTVIHGQFLKQIGIIRERERSSASLPEATKALIRSAGIKQIPEEYRLSDGEMNDRRNTIFNQLEGLRS